MRLIEHQCTLPFPSSAHSRRFKDPHACARYSERTSQELYTALFYRHKKTRYLERVLYTSTGGVLVIYGARSRNRTGTKLPSRDFKSLASTYSAIRAVEA